jgi:hypothetical protein
MNWTALLAKAGIPDSPGRPEAVIAAINWSKEKRAIRHGPKRQAAAKRKPHYPSIKHSAD